MEINMEIDSVNFVALLSWGFLVGFVGGGSCFRIVFPLSDFLIGSDEYSALTLITRIFVTLFIMAGLFFSLALMPLFLITLGKSSSTQWRSILGISFLGFWIGYFFLGFARRISRAGKKREKMESHPRS